MDFKEIVKRIKSEYSIVDYIKSSGVALDSGRSGSHKGLCPFHNEKTPSFHVNEDFQSYKCFGCGESGDIISFAMKAHTISMTEALKMLADERGIEYNIKANDENAADITGIRKVLEDAQRFFRSNFEKLPITHPAKAEITKRSLSIENPLYGYSLEAPDALYRYLKEKGHSDKNIKDSNLVIFFEEENRKPWDFFHGRLMITLSDYLGKPISFTSRKIFEDDRMPGKYVNGKESPIFSKKTNLFGADNAKKSARAKKKIYVVEGQFDKIAIEENGYPNVVGTSGTAFTQEHANLLMRMVGETGEIIFIMDGDNAGIEAALKVFKTASTLHMNSKAVKLPDKMDPCDYIFKYGIEKLIEEADKAKPLHDFVIDSIMFNLGAEISVSNRQHFVSEVCSYAKFAKDSFIVDSMLKKASIISAISIDNVKEMFSKTEVKTRPDFSKKTEETKEKGRLQPKIKIDLRNEADSCMFNAIAILVRIPDETIEHITENIHEKFEPFVSEVKRNYKSKLEQGKDWRFIEEEYEDVDFAKALKNKVFILEPKEDVKGAASQCIYLFEKAYELYTAEKNSMNKAKALSSLIDTTNPKDIAEALKLFEDFHSKED